MLNPRHIQLLCEGVALGPVLELASHIAGFSSDLEHGQHHDLDGNGCRNGHAGHQSGDHQQD